MAAKKPSTNAVVQRAQVQLPAEIEQAMASSIAEFQGRMSAPVGNRITVTQDKKFKNAAGEKWDTMRGVIVDFIAKKAYYEGDYDKNNIVPPNCFAMGFMPHDSLEHSENAPEPVHADGCKACPYNQFKTAKNGNGKACKDSYVLAVMSTGADEDGSYKLVTLELSATAIKPFEKYVRDLARDTGKAPYAFETEFFFDDKSDYASVRCAPVNALPVELVTAAFGLRDDARKLLSVEPNVSEFEEKVVALRNKKPAGKSARR